MGRWWQQDPVQDGLPGLSAYHQTFGNPVAFADPLGLWPEPGLNRHIGESAGEQWNREHGMGEGYTNPVFAQSPSYQQQQFNNMFSAMQQGNFSINTDPDDPEVFRTFGIRRTNIYYQSYFGNGARVGIGEPPFYQQSVYRSILLGTSTLVSGVGTFLGTGEHGFGAAANYFARQQQSYGSIAWRWGVVPRVGNLLKATSYSLARGLSSTIAGAGKFLGTRVFIIGAVVSTTQLVHASAHGRSDVAFKAGSDLTMGAVGLLGLPGFAASSIYFGVDYLIGWDNAFEAAGSITEQNRAILGPNWSPFRMSGAP